ncbi:MAG: hypothetical protein LBM38_03560 [Clostridiales bacterium]|jgi:ribonuclease BN (tRNA processing enzyme)|nr:hypothetical protein [Clostridiales bacterium]
MKLTVLGTQSPIASVGHHGPGFMVQSGDNTIILDCGTHSLVDFARCMNNLHIFISHLHCDHYSDIFAYQYGSTAYRNLGLLTNPINIYLPESPAKDADFIMNHDNLQFTNYNSIGEDKTYKIGDMTVSFCKTTHPVETYAMKVSDGDKTIVYTADTNFASGEKLAGFAKNADILICESSLLEEYNSPAISSHLTAKQAGQLANMAGANTLLLTHFWHNESLENYKAEAEKEFANVICATEGKVFDLPKRKISLQRGM